MASNEETGSMMLMPPRKDHCRICAVKHEPDVPHNAQSLFFQMRFKMRYGRDGTWADAIAHCSEPVKEHWERELKIAKVWTQPPDGVEVIIEAIDG